MIDFHPIHSPAFEPGIVLRIGDTDYRYLRLTHVFEHCSFAMWVGTAENARYAKRPHRMTNEELLNLAAQPTSVWGKLALPDRFLEPIQPDSERSNLLHAAWNLVGPLAEAFEREANLSRTTFIALIRARALATNTSEVTLRRLVLRYYYFGRTRLAVLPLPPGVKAGTEALPKRTDASIEKSTPKRRGRQTVLVNEIGRNDFMVSEDDIADMVDSLKKCLRKGATFVTNAHEVLRIA